MKRKNNDTSRRSDTFWFCVTAGIWIVLVVFFCLAMSGTIVPYGK